MLMKGELIMVKSIDQILDESLTKVEKALNKDLQERISTYPNDLNISDITKLILNESRSFSATTLSVVLKELIKEGYLNNPER